MSIQKLEKQQVFRDPLYGYIHIDYSVIKKLINSSVFQRLRRIKQLSGVYMVFHCAEHSRFGHSLGVYELINRFLIGPNFSDKFSEREKILALCAGLLHDIGHGAYSHAFEDVFNINHEKIGAKIITNNKELKAILDEIDSSFAFDIASIILKENKFPIIEKLISSQIDADRMDYLMRDAYFTGTTYGAVDFERIMRVVRIRDDKIVFKASGLHAIENYLISRYHMYWQIYYHPTARAYEFLLEMIYKRFKDLVSNNYVFSCDTTYLNSIIINPEDIDVYLEIDDNYINSLIKKFMNENDTILGTLATDFINRRIWHNIENTPENKEQIKNIKDEFAELEAEYYCGSREVSGLTYKEDNADFGDKIFILTDDDKIVSLKEYSLVIKSLSTSGKKKDKRFFYRDAK